MSVMETCLGKASLIEEVKKKLGLAIRDGVITTNKIKDKAVTSDKIADGAVTSEKIGNNSITMDKLSDSLKQTISNVTQGGSSKENQVIPIYNLDDIPSDVLSGGYTYEYGDLSEWLKPGDYGFQSYKDNIFIGKCIDPTDTTEWEMIDPNSILNDTLFIISYPPEEISGTKANIIDLCVLKKNNGEAEFVSVGNGLTFEYIN